jgi:hypothetical protein
VYFQQSEERVNDVTSYWLSCLEDKKMEERARDVVAGLELPFQVFLEVGRAKIGSSVLEILLQVFLKVGWAKIGGSVLEVLLQVSQVAAQAKTEVLCLA